jgi:transcription antitermination factor NusG
LTRELSAIHRLLVHGRNPVDLYSLAAEGTAVRIVTGALQGIRGVVVGRRDGKACLVLQVSILGQSVAVEIEAGMLEPA